MFVQIVHGLIDLFAIGSFCGALLVGAGLAAGAF